MHRDTQVAQSARGRGRSSRLRASVDNRGTRNVDNWISLREEALLLLARLMRLILNLSMLLSPKCNVHINLRSMVRRFSATRLAR